MSCPKQIKFRLEITYFLYIPLIHKDENTTEKKEFIFKVFNFYLKPHKYVLMLQDRAEDLLLRADRIGDWGRLGRPPQKKSGISL